MFTYGIHLRHSEILYSRRTGDSDDRLFQGLSASLRMVPQSRIQATGARAFVYLPFVRIVQRLQRGMPVKSAPLYGIRA